MVSSRRFQPEEDAAILDGYRMGVSLHALADQMSRHHMSIRCRLHLLLSEAGEPTPVPAWKKWNNQEIRDAYRLAGEGMSYEHIGLHVGRSAKAVKGKLDEIRQGRCAHPDDLDFPEDKSILRVPEKNAPTVPMRPCLKCRKPFRSAHSMNRLCSACAAINRGSGLSVAFEMADSW